MVGRGKADYQFFLMEEKNKTHRNYNIKNILDSKEFKQQPYFINQLDMRNYFSIENLMK